MVENVTNWMEEKRKDEGEGVQGSWSDEVDGEGEHKVDQDVMSGGAGRANGCNKSD